MALDPRGMGEAIVRNLPEKTGRSLAQWLDVLASEGPASTRERIDWLKREHGVGHYTARAVVAHAGGEGAPDPGAYDDSEALVTSLFGPPGSDLRVRYEGLRRDVEATVPQVRATACRGYVGFATRRQFAAVRPRGGALQLGLRPGDAEIPGEVRVTGLGGGSLTRAVTVDDAGGRLDDAVRAAIAEIAKA
jgi:hypothetical protein